MALNWDVIKENAGGDFMPWAPTGTYTVEAESVTLRVSSTGTNWLDFNFKSDQYSYPKISHPLSFKNMNWRCWHFKCLFELFGLDDASAKKTVETAEGKKGNEEIADTYEALFNRLISTKHPKVDIEVWRTAPNAAGKTYARGDFNDEGIRMSHPEDDAPLDPKQLPLGASEVKADEKLDVPF